MQKSIHVHFSDTMIGLRSFNTAIYSSLLLSGTAHGSQESDRFGRQAHERSA